jgi:PKD repeat protein
MFLKVMVVLSLFRSYKHNLVEKVYKTYILFNEMKKECGLIFVLVMLIGFACASISVNDFILEEDYSPFDLIKGEMNVTIIDEPLNSEWSSNLDVKENEDISLKDFLENNGADYSCLPSDCSNDFTSSSSATSKNVALGIGDEAYVGFVLTGDDIEVSGLSFGLESNFAAGSSIPLKIEFFGNGTWTYDDFSDEYAPASYGCYDRTEGVADVPIRSAKYCEKIYLPETNSMEIGAIVNQDDNKSLKMEVYMDLSDPVVASCVFDAESEESCRVDATSGDGGIYSSGDYYICVGALTGQTTDYLLFSENAGANCGYIPPEGEEESVKDYGIFAKSAKYNAASDDIAIGSADFVEFAAQADSLIHSKTGGDRDCSEGCILPLKITGVQQNLKIKDLVLDYKDGGEDKSSMTLIYDLNEIPAEVDYSGILYLEMLGFKIVDENIFRLSFNGVKVLNGSVSVLPAPIIQSVSPTNPPAGFPVTFYAGVDFDGSGDLSYKWDFGDGKIGTSIGNSIVHTYGVIKNYTLELEVSAGGNLSTTRSFEISAVSPEVALNLSLDKKTKDLEESIKNINTFPIWYQEVLERVVGIQFYQDELTRLTSSYKKAFSDDDFVDVAKELYTLNFPTAVFVGSQGTMPLFTDLNDIDANPVQTIAGGGSGEDLAGYKNPILRWQDENIISTIGLKSIYVTKENGDRVGVLNVYLIDVDSSADEESYFVIMRERADLTFRETSFRSTKAGSSTVITVDAGQKMAFEFFYENVSDAVMFVSPRLSSLVLEAPIDKTCNHNKVCEPANGENTKTCRDDCKPVGGLIFWMIMAFVFVLILYTVLQIWYKSRYEKFLFSDRRHLYNVVMFISNARAQGREDEKIEELLEKAGWTGEQVRYAMRKSKGQRTGMYEIIPVEKLFAWRRNSKARKDVAAGNVSGVPSSMAGIGVGANPSIGKRVGSGIGIGAGAGQGVRKRVGPGIRKKVGPGATSPGIGKSTNPVIRKSVRPSVGKPSVAGSPNNAGVSKKGGPSAGKKSI